MIYRVTRWSGLLLIAGGTVLGISIALITLNLVPNKPLAPFVSLMLLLSSILLLVSLPAMYARQVDAAGWSGLAGYALLETGLLLIVIAGATPLRFPAYNPPGSGENAVDFLLALALALGLLLTSIATIRARVLPRGAGILLLAATLGFFFDFFVAEALPDVAGRLGGALLGVLLAVGFVWIGIAMLQGTPGPNTRVTAPAQPKRAL